MKIFKNLFGTNDKINASEIAVAPGLLLPGAVIVESGSNSNGTYVKFGDGTMLCWTNGAVTLTYFETTLLTYLWTFPQPFANTNTLVVPNTGIPPVGKRQSTTPNTTGITTSSVTIRIHSDGGDFVSGNTVSARPFAIGRWKI